MEEFLRFGRFKKECVKIQEAMPPLPLPTPMDGSISLNKKHEFLSFHHSSKSDVNCSLLQERKCIKASKRFPGRAIRKNNDSEVVRLPPQSGRLC